MSYEKITDSIFMNSLVFEGYAEDNVEAEIRPADYFPDVERILKVENIPQITGKRAAGDKLYIDGTLLMRVFYITGESPRLNCVSVSKLFSRTFDLPKAAVNASVEATAVIQYKNARLINPRKVELTTSVGISVKVYEKTESEFLSAVSDGKVELQQKRITADSFIGYCERIQKLNEELNLPEAKPPIICVLKTTATAFVRDVKAITNKAIMKGEVRLTVIYMAENGNVPERMEYTLPVTQIVDIEGLSEESNLCPRMTCDEHKLELIPTQTGDLRAIRLDAQVTFGISAYEEREITVCTDAYSTTDVLRIENSSLYASRLVENGLSSAVTKETLEFSRSEVKQIYDVWGTLTLMERDESDDGISIRSNLCVTVLAYDHDDRLCCVDSDIPVTYTLPVKSDGGKLAVTPGAKLCNIGYTISGENLIDIRAEIEYTYPVFSVNEYNILRDADYASDKTGAEAPMTVYFAEAGEDVWSIAKSHNAALVPLMNDNGISEEILSAPKVICIFGR